MRLIGVGVGPGDPELITLRAVRVLSTAGRVFVPVLPASAQGGEPGRAEATVRAHAAHDRIERLVFALNERHDAARRERYWDAAGRRVAQWLAETGGTAAFATIGDPNLYSTFGYLAQTVQALQPAVEVQTVPGITAMQALASATGVPLAEGSEPLVLLPLAPAGGLRASSRGADAVPRAFALLTSTLAQDATVVLYKCGRQLAEVSDMLKSLGRLDEAVLGTHLGLPEERVEPLVDAAESAPYLSTVLIPVRRSARGAKLDGGGRL